MLSRRRLLSHGAMLSLGATLSRPALAQSKPKCVIIGGGPGGGSVLRALAASAAGKIDITLIEAQPEYSACFHSNLYLGGFEPRNKLEFSFDGIKKLAGVKVITAAAEMIEREKREVVLEGGGSIPYDLLVLSPGIELDYASVPGWSKEAEQRMPHAWKGGAQLELLKKQLDSIPDGGLILVLAPPAPYRCPPGPYERVSMMAHALTAAGKKQAHIIILDAKESFSKQPLFQ
ncbi:MAG: FAD/NAD(P)-binding oxidoreductase, partial [Rhodomicrobium sp.]